MAEIEVKIKDKEVLQQINQKLEQAVRQACIMVQDDAKQACPVRTGRLQGSISHEVESSDSGVEGIVGTNVEYGPFVELRKPFLKPAGEKNRESILNLFKGLV